ncbi:MAG: DUF1640 domain-containing protein [Nitrospirae bacterium]|nr:DUF1640 domain-containing protein [Magnetococcales bacterium]HAT50086.1 DUF1640 domain-containing protein [Alphaproteobacteria bacterium]
MTTITFDTLEFTERLTRDSGVPEDQARGHAKAMARVFEQVEDSRLKELATKGDIRLLEGDIQQLELKIEARIAESKAETIKWMIGLLLAQTGLIITIFKLFPSH